MIGTLALARPVHGGGTDEPLGWRVGPAAWTFNRFTFFEAVDKTAALGLHSHRSLRGTASQQGDLGEDRPRAFERPARAGPRKAEGVWCHASRAFICISSQETRRLRKAFEFCRKLGAETIVSEPPPDALNVLERLCDEYGVNLAIHNHPRGSSRYWHPQEVLKVCDGRSPRVGACADVGHWQRSGIRPVDGVRLLGSRLLSLNVKDLNELGLPAMTFPGAPARERSRRCSARSTSSGSDQPSLRSSTSTTGTTMPRRSPSAPGSSRRRLHRSRASPPVKDSHCWWAGRRWTSPRRVRSPWSDSSTSGSQREFATRSRPRYWHWKKRGERGAEQAVLVSCDLVSSPHAIQQRLQEKVKGLVPELDAGKVFINATHTHTAPGLIDGKFKGLYGVSKDPGVMKASEYAEFFIDRVSKAVAQAWQGRKPGGVSWAVSQAVVGYNRRGRIMPAARRCCTATRPLPNSQRRGRRGSLRRCPLPLGSPAQADRTGRQCGLPRSGDGASLRDLGRLLARRAGRDPSPARGGSVHLAPVLGGGRPVAAPDLSQGLRAGHRPPAVALAA